VIQGLTGGSIAAVAAALVSLPLHSPNDVLFGTVPIVAGSLLLGLAAGAVWTRLASGPNPKSRFALIWLAAFAVSVVAMAVVDSWLDRMLSFGAPLAATNFVVTGAFTLSAPGVPFLRSRWLTAIGFLIALAVGLGLAGQGDQESGRLELPPRATGTVVPDMHEHEVA
jgi:peptidoglycan/LPS O-acetylase OafA/YrhL